MLVVLVLLLALCRPCASEVKPGFFADNGFSNALSTITHPNGEYFNGITYISYQGPHEDPYIISYEHATKEWKGPFKVGVSTMGVYPDAEKGDFTDNHGRPTLVMSDDGYINIFFGGHGGCPEREGIKNKFGIGCHSGRQIHVRSMEPENIEKWHVPDSNISPFGCYASSIKMDNGDIYVFVRHGAHQADWTYQVSKDGGKSFEDEVSVLKTKKTKFDDGSFISDSWYVHFFRSHQGNKKKDVIGCCYVYHKHEGGTKPRKHGYYHYVSIH
jgi:hypothetical protein